MNKLIETTFLIICFFTALTLLYGFGMIEQMAMSVK